MGIANRVALAILYVFFVFQVKGSEDVEFKDPYLLEVADFAAASVLKQEEFGLENRTLHKILDAQITPYPQPTPTQYLLSLEFGAECPAGSEACSNGRFICEATVLDEPWAKKRSVESDSSRCAPREPSVPLEFIEAGSSIASLLNVDDPQTKAIAEVAVAQMAQRKGGKHALKVIGRARKVMMEETSSNLYYLTLYISTNDNDTANEVCEVTMEEVLTGTSTKTLQSLRCFTTGDNEGADSLGIVRVSPDELTASLMRHAVLASLAVIDAESQSQFQLKVIGYALEDSRVSVDSGTRDLQLKLGLVPTICIKTQDDEEAEGRSCSIDTEKDPSMCGITLTQWPWVADGYLFSDFHCESSNYDAIGEELEAFSDDESQSSGEDGLEVEEVSSNAVQATNRSENEEETLEEDEEGKEVEESTFVSRMGPCAGCPQEFSPSSPEALEKANFALSAFEGAINGEKALSVVRVVKATSQVVAGSLYELTVEVVATDCLRSANLERSKCQVDPEAGRHTCTVSILNQPWTGPDRVLEAMCNESVELESRSLKSGLVGGPRANVTLSPDDEEVKKAATFALDRLDAFDDNSKKRVLVQVLEATSHIVARSKTYKLKVKVALVDCPEESSSNDPACQPTSQSTAYFCDVQVLAQAATERYIPKRLVDSKCFPAAVDESAPPRPQLLGAPVDRVVGSSNEEDPYIQSVAQFATSAINQRINDNSVKLLRVVRAQTQIVAGKNVILDVEVGFTNCSNGKATTGDGCQIDASRDPMICHVTVWDRAWLNDRRVTNLTCDSTSLSSIEVQENAAEPVVDAPAALPGGETASDNMSEQIEGYADFALAVVEEQFNGEEKMKITRILASSVQVVEGLNVRLTLEIAPTNCSKDQLENVCSVLSDSDKDWQICNIQIWDRAWLQEKQVTDLNCRPKSKKKLSGTRVSKSEDIGESPFVGEVPKTYRLGGSFEFKKPKKTVAPSVNATYRPVDPNDEAVKQLATFAASSIKGKGPSSGEPLTLLKISSVARQVVANVLNYKMTLQLKNSKRTVLCDVLLSEDIAATHREVSSSTCAGPKHRQTAGGFDNVDPAEPVVKEMAAFAASAISEASNAETPLTLITVSSAAKQIVAGVNYRMNLVLGGSGADQLSCSAVVFDQSWTDTRKLSSFSCNDQSGANRFNRRLSKMGRSLTRTRSATDPAPPLLGAPPSVVGGYTPVDVEAKDVKEIATFATTTLSSSLNSGSLTLVRVTAAAKQVVAGLNYQLTLELDGPDGITTCNVTVFDQVWTGTRKISNSDCLPSLSAAPGEIRSNPVAPLEGSFSEIDVEDETVKDIAQFATSTLSESSNGGTPINLIRIVSASKQIVAGANYKLVLELSGSNGGQRCTVQVFDQSWTGTRKVNSFSCVPLIAPSIDAPSPENDQVIPAPVLQATGAYQEADPEDEQVKKMASFATTSLSQSMNSKSLSLVKIVSAEKQVVGGVNYKLVLELSDPSGSITCSAVVFDQAWTGTRKLSDSSCLPEAVRQVRNDPTPAPRQTGGFTEIDVEDETVMDIAQFATSTLSESSNGASPIRLIRIVSASKQVVAGANYKLVLELSGSNGGQRCTVEIFDQSWTGTRKVNSFSCVPLIAPSIDAPSPENDQVIQAPVLQATGAYQKADPEDEDVKEMASFATTSLSQSMNSKSLSLVKIVSAEKQVVGGVNYKLVLELSDPSGSITCTAVVFDQAWTGTRKLSDSSCLPEAVRQVRSDPVPVPRQTGGFTDIDVEDAIVKDIAQFATSTLSQSSNDGTPFNLVKIVSASKQVVAGANYKLSLVLSGSNGGQTCTVVVFDQSWTGTRKLSSFECVPFAVPPSSDPSSGNDQVIQAPVLQATGAYQKADPEDEKVKEMASFATTTLSQSMNSKSLSLVKIVSAEKQIVGGVNYKLVLELSDPNGSITCTAVVFDQAWTSTRKLSDSNCLPAAVRQVRQAGSFSDVDVNDATVKDIAQFATQSLSKLSNGGSPLSVIKITSASKQVVAGANYKLTLELSGSNGGQTCTVEVFDQSWTGTRKLNKFSCLPFAEPPSVRVLRNDPTPSPPGSFSSIDIADPVVKEIATFATDTISKSMNSGSLSLSKITSASKQVVAGANYKLSLQLSGSSGDLNCEVHVFDQSWTNTRELTKFNCVPASAPQVQQAPIRKVGGYTTADPNAADVKEVASFAATTLSQSMNSGSLSLVEITSAEKQVVAGINYKLTLKLSGSAGSMTCSVVIFDQSWTGTRKLSTSSCVPDAVPATSIGSRIARNEPTKGEFVAVDGDDVDVKDVALFASSTLSSVLNPGEPLYLVKVASASKQVLGEPANYKLRLELVGSNGRVYCNVEVYDHPVTGDRKLSSVGCVPESQPPPPVRRRRRSGGVMTGGFSPMDLKGSKVQELATFAAQTISQRSNEPGTPNVLRVLKASKQVVSGMKYNLELDIGYSECTKDSDSCLRRQRCTVTIWEQVWLQKKELTKMACKEVKKNGKLSVKLSHQPSRSHSRLGGVQPADPDSEEIRSQAALALESVQAQSNSEKLLNVVRIKSAATQVVSGKKTFLSLEIGQTKCNSNKTESTDSADCPFDDQADRQMCKVEIWSRPWLNERKVTSLKCIPLAPPKPCAAGKSCPRNKRQSAASRRQAKNRKKVNRLKYMSAFRAYGIEFQKVYKTWSEFEHRYKIYRANQKRIELLNLNEMGTAVYGDTPFSDWTEKEFQDRLTGLKPHLRPSNSILSKAVIPKIDLPDEFDWRHFNVVTPVKNQGSCGSCWAFSVTGNVEGVYGVKHGELVSLSEQELVDCDTLDSGCNGGLPENAYKAIQDIGGLEEENDYPYNGHDNKCDFNANVTRVQVTGGVEISTNETEMAQWLVENGPISIGINANGMQFYRGGISHPWKVLCRPGGIDHGVLIVGYGVASYPQFKKTLPYWIVKNSWGTKWGEQGYYRVFRGDGTCGVNQMATSAVIA